MAWNEGAQKLSTMAPKDFLRGGGRGGRSKVADGKEHTCICEFRKQNKDILGD